MLDRQIFPLQCKDPCLGPNSSCGSNAQCKVRITYQSKWEKMCQLDVLCNLPKKIGRMMLYYCHLHLGLKPRPSLFLSWRLPRRSLVSVLPIKKRLTSPLGLFIIGCESNERYRDNTHYKRRSSKICFYPTFQCLFKTIVRAEISCNQETLVWFSACSILSQENTTPQ